MKVQTRNLNPHKPAIVAMYMWCEEYSKQGGGSVDFWDSLSDYDKRTCRECVDKIEKANKEGKQ